MLKQTAVYLSQRCANHAPGQWFGPHVMTWARAPWGWVLLGIEPAEARK